MRDPPTIYRYVSTGRHGSSQWRSKIFVRDPVRDIRSTRRRPVSVPENRIGDEYVRIKQFWYRLTQERPQTDDLWFVKIGYVRCILDRDWDICERCNRCEPFDVLTIVELSSCMCREPIRVDTSIDTAVDEVCDLPNRTGSNRHSVLSCRPRWEMNACDRARADLPCSTVFCGSLSVENVI